MYVGLLHEPESAMFYCLESSHILSARSLLDFFVIRTDTCPIGQKNHVSFH